MVGDLTGKWFHSYNAKGERQYQGKVEQHIVGETYMVSVYNWLDGYFSCYMLFSITEMSGWKFYSCNADMNEAAEKEN